MTFRSLSVLLVCGLALAGCNDRSSPETLLKTTQDALAKADMKNYRKSLSPELRATWGTLARAAELQARVVGDDVTLGEVKPVSTDRSRDRLTETQIFEATVLRGRATTMTTRVTCTVSYEYECGTEGGFCTPDTMGDGYWCRFPRRDGSGETYCRRNSPDEAPMRLMTRSCLISSISI